MTPDEITTQLSQQAQQCHQLLDAISRQWQQEYQDQGGQLFCRAGCANCCRLQVQATWNEALSIAAHLDIPQHERLAGYLPRLQQLTHEASDYKNLLHQIRQQLPGCPFLDDSGCCTIYPWRPLACRALLSTREASWCGLDFADLNSEQKQNFMAGLDPQVVDFPTHYAAAPRQFAAALEQQLMQRQQQLTGTTLCGNLPLLVHLAADPSVRDVLHGPPQQAQQQVKQLEQNWPWLINPDIAITLSPPAHCDKNPRR
ncbi:MAG: YkgJ family cysteine cluster protein [Desulfuromonadaceae bacterium]|nr:YkgJ family cysteine cluster protein [Desulfuromonadaceae bacterium]